MKWSSSAWASADPSVGSVPAPSSSRRTSVPGPGPLHDPDDRAQVARERRQGLRDRLLVADVGEDVAEHRQHRAGLGRDVEPGLVHQGEQPEGPHRDRLAAGVGPRDDERRVAVAEPDVDRHDAPGEPRVARRQQDDLLVRGRRGAHRRPCPRPAAPSPSRSRTARAPRASPRASSRWPRPARSARRGSGRPPRPPRPAPRARRCPAPRRRAAPRTASGRCPTRRAPRP